MRACQRCEQNFKSIGRGFYCPACSDLLNERRCAHSPCGRPFRPQSPSKKQVYCSKKCGSAAYSARVTDAKGMVACQYEPCGKLFVPHDETRRFCSDACSRLASRRLTRVRCAWSGCPRPDDLIAGHKYHGDCWHADRKPTIISTCLACGGEITDHRPRKLHRECRGAFLRRRGTRPCGQCGKLLERTVLQIAHTQNSFCNRACAAAWKRDHPEVVRVQLARYIRRTQVEVRCVSCGGIRRYIPGALPRTVDRKSLTWTCLACLPRKSVVPTLMCPECGDVFRRRIKDYDPSKSYHCNSKCRWAAHRKHFKGMVRLTCPYCKQEAEDGLRDFSQITFEVPRSRLNVPLPDSGERCCSRSHATRYAQQEWRRRIPCVVCGTRFRPIKGRETSRHCSRDCWKRRGSSGRPIANPRLERAKERILEAARFLNHDKRRSWTLMERSGVSRPTIKKLLADEVFARQLHSEPFFDAVPAVQR